MNRRRGRRGVRLGAAVLALGALGGCTPGSFSSFSSFPESPSVPDTEIEYHIDATADSDLVTIYAQDAPALAEVLLPALGMEHPVILDSGLEVGGAYTEIRDTGRKRLITRDGETWLFQADLGPIGERLAAQKIDEFRVTVCHPAVAVFILDALPSETEALCDEPFGLAWDVKSADSDRTLKLRFSPSVGHWKAFVVATAIWFGLYSVIAFGIGRIVRRDVGRSGGKLAATALILSFLTAALLWLAFFGIAAMAGPSDNYALARDAGAVGWAGAGLVPSAAAFVPWIAFGVTLLWGRPWRRARAFRIGEATPGALRPPSPPPV